MPRKNKNKKQLKSRKSRPSAKRAVRKTSATKKNTAKTQVVAAVLSPEKLQELYATMLKCHLLNERLADVIPQRRRATRVTEVAHEAVLAGAIAHAIPGDETVTAEDGFLAAFIRGTPLASVLAGVGNLAERRNGTEPGATTNGMRLGQAEANGVGSHTQATLERASGLAAGKKGSSTAVLAFTGEFRTERAALYEQLRTAAQSKLPIVCFVETSLAELDALPPSTAGSKTGEDHFPQIAVDGNDVVAVFRVAQEAIRRARTGHGPSMIECVMPEQTAKYSSAQDSAKKLSSPLAFMRKYLRRRKLWSDGWQQRIIREFTQELNSAIASMDTTSSQQNRIDQAYSAKLAPEPASA